MTQNKSKNAAFLIREKFLYSPIILLTLAITFSGGCATTDSGKTKTEGAGIGAVMGAIVGTVAASFRCDSDKKDCAKARRQGATVGAVAGGAAGYAYGTHVANKKTEYASEEAYLNDVIANAAKVAEEAKVYNVDLKKQLTVLDKKKSELISATDRQEQNKASIRKNNEELITTIKQTENELKLVTNEISIQNKVIERERESAPARLINVALGGVTELEIQERALQQSLAQLKLIDNRRAY